MLNDMLPKLIALNKPQGEEEEEEGVLSFQEKLVALADEAQFRPVEKQLLDAAKEGARELQIDGLHNSIYDHFKGQECEMKVRKKEERDGVYFYDVVFYW